MQRIAFTVIGIPKAQPRPRAFARKMGDTFVARVYDAGTAEAWKGDIAIAARGHIPEKPLEGPIRVDIDFLFPRPKCRMRKCDPDGEYPHTVKPDRDNAEKAATDCLTTLGFFTDDCQICAGEVRKFWVAKGGKPGARITISTPFKKDLSRQPVSVTVTESPPILNETTLPARGPARAGFEVQP